ncbi:hypothetical protein BFP72_18785 [Reichenbachiella sp. 5M10]|uniref:hypothetical protein n=1 Tax=Reichenbachiella sp. 5M10 TaxID=1889772 RepID=UPI000C1502C6|nr:hypothetical protein [Reichenbachiella sp. 5M10]PIB37310.1 hypothetical protein BFP72_18785 [Reichenbachiella sp. 5M10]
MSITKLTYALVVVLLFVLSPLCTEAQQYHQSAGVRYGSKTSALTYKKFLKGEHAIEAWVSGRDEGVQLTTLYLHHIPMSVASTDNFYFYVGVGGHLGYQKNKKISKRIDQYSPDDYYYFKDEFVEMGIDAMIGVEYRLLRIPMSVNVDLKPYLNYIGFRKLDGDFWDGAIGLKYIF